MSKDYTINENWTEVKEPEQEYLSDPVNDITYKIIGVCFDVYNELGRGFAEVVYKDAIEYEFKKRAISFEWEKKFNIKYKDTILPHYYFADFVVENKVILEIKASQGIIEDHFKQVINYLAVSNSPLALLINFGEASLKYKRRILTK
jgi:GxxExxY protein